MNYKKFTAFLFSALLLVAGIAARADTLRDNLGKHAISEASSPAIEVNHLKSSNYGKGYFARQNKPDASPNLSAERPDRPNIFRPERPERIERMGRP